jgi:hypothetical protein
MTLNGRALVLADIDAERDAQEAKFPDQELPSGTGGSGRWDRAEAYKGMCEYAREAGQLTWTHVLEEEVAEALAESDVALLREELIQVAAVAVRWVEQIDREQYG